MLKDVSEFCSDGAKTDKATGRLVISDFRKRTIFCNVYRTLQKGKMTNCANNDELQIDICPNEFMKPFRKCLKGH